jgi:hypothetical protein
MLIGVISDTHGFLNSRVYHLFNEVDHILHAGDIGDDRVLDELEAIAPVNAVSGNMDMPPEVRRPMMFTGDFAGVRISMTHGHMLDGDDYNRSAIGMFSYNEPRIIVHGHTHVAKHDTVDGVAIINPGAAGKARFEMIPSVAILDISPDRRFTVKFFSL